MLLLKLAAGDCRSMQRENSRPTFGRPQMLFMVIERFERNDMLPVYERLKEKGRGLPQGLKYVSSWIEPTFARCFQLMECEDPRLFQEWVLHWHGTGVTFEIVPVVQSDETREVVASFLGRST
jgi:hypothetical protein